MRIVEGAVQRHLARIQADAGPRLFQPVLKIILTGNKVKSDRLSAVREDEIEKGIQGIFLLLGGDLRNCAPNDTSTPTVDILTFTSDGA